MDPNSNISGPSSTASETPFRWRADNDPTLNASLVDAIFQGIQTCIARKPYIFVIFQWGSGPPVSPSGSAYDMQDQNSKKLVIVDHLVR